jgi:hypothetical protein
VPTFLITPFFLIENQIEMFQIISLGSAYLKRDDKKCRGMTESVVKEKIFLIVKGGKNLKLEKHY